MKPISKTVISLCLIFAMGSLYFYQSTLQKTVPINPAELPGLINDRSIELKQSSSYSDVDDPDQIIEYFATQNRVNILSKTQNSMLWELQLAEASTEDLVEWLAQLDAHGLKIQTIKVLKSADGNKIRVPVLTLIRMAAAPE